MLTTLITFLDPNGDSPDCALVAGNDGYYYGRTAQGGDSGHGTIFSFSFDAPYFVTQPTNQTAFTGGQVVFHVAAGSASPLSHQWQKNSVNLSAGGNIASVTNADLVLANVSPADIGTYSVVVSNAVGAVTSAGAALTLGLTPPTVNPPLKVALAGGQLVFNVHGTPGAPFVILSADTLGGPAGSWATVVSGALDRQGHFSLVIVPDPTKTQQLFALKTP